jgi:hypothetical protein
MTAAPARPHRGPAAHRGPPADCETHRPPPPRRDPPRDAPPCRDPRLQKSCAQASLSLLALCALVAAASAPAAERYEGTAYVRGTNRVAYRETDWLFQRDGIEQRLVLYRCPGGAPFARKWVRDVPNAIAPDFDFLDARTGYREGVRTDHGARQIFLQENAHAPLETRPLPAQPDGVLDAGFDAYVRQHWQELTTGNVDRIEFLIPSRFEYIGLKLSGSREASYEGAPARQLRMGLSAWYGFAVPAIELTYDPNGRRLEEFEGLGTIRNAAGHNQNVRIEFPAKADLSDVPDAEVDRAAATALVSSCGS